MSTHTVQDDGYKANFDGWGLNLLVFNVLLIRIEMMIQ